MKSKTVLIFSGGLDSTTLLFQLLAAGDEVIPLSVDYGQRHARELDAAALIVDLARHQYPNLCHEHQGVPLQFLPSLYGDGEGPQSSQLGHAEVPDGHYADQTMKTTVVPNRNMIMLAIAAGCAQAWGADVVATAVHAGDHTIYPDCRIGFVAALRTAIQLATLWSPVTLDAPYVTISKAEIVARGVSVGAPLSETWSCYKGGDYHCGTCGTCVERREAFILAGVPDPTVYLDNGPLPEEPRA